MSTTTQGQNQTPDSLPKNGVGGAYPTGMQRASYVFFGSASVSFAAFMEYLRALQQGMSAMAEMSEATTEARSNVAQTLASATYNAGINDANQLSQQANEQIASAVSSGVQAAAAVGGFAATRKASTASENMSKLAQSARESDGPQGVTGSTNAPDAAGAAAVKTADIKEAVAQLKAGKAEELAASKDPMDTSIGKTGVTLKGVLSSSERNNALEEIGSRQKLAIKTLTSRQNYVQFLTQGANMVGQMAASSATAQFKINEADQMTQKATQSKLQSLSQAGTQFMQETGQSQAKQSDQYNDTSKQVWQSIHELVQVDTRG